MNDMTNENQLIVVKEYEFDKTDIHEIDYILDDVIKDCRKKYFHSFEYRIIYDLCFKNISNNEEVNFAVTHRSMEFKTEFYGEKPAFIIRIFSVFDRRSIFFAIVF